MISNSINIAALLLYLIADAGDGEASHHPSPPRSGYGCVLPTPGVAAGVRGIACRMCRSNGLSYHRYV